MLAKTLPDGEVFTNPFYGFACVASMNEFQCYDHAPRRTAALGRQQQHQSHGIKSKLRRIQLLRNFSVLREP